MDPLRNPYAPGAGQRPPELAGRDRQRQAFDVTLERMAHGRPERSMVLSGLRGVGKTVLLNALRSQAVSRAWGTGKLEARPEQGLRLPLAQALHAAVRELGHRHRDPERVEQVVAVLSAFAQRVGPAERRAQPRQRGRERPVVRWRPAADVPAARGRADSGDLELDLVELLGDVGDLACDLGVGVAVFVDEMQDLGADDMAALCGAWHEMSQRGAPVVVVGAGLPHLPTALSASKSYAERLFGYVRVDRLPRQDADRALTVPAGTQGVSFTREALDLLHALTDGYPYFVQAYGKATWDAAPATPVRPDDVRAAAPEAEDELAIGFFGARFERATPAERDYMQAMAEAMGAATGARDPGTAGDPAAPGDGVPPGGAPRDGAPRDGACRDGASRDGAPGDGVPGDRVPGDRVPGDGSVGTAEVAASTGRRPQSLSPARDGLIKKGLVYAAARGQVAFTVPHFAAYLRTRHG